MKPTDQPKERTGKIKERLFSLDVLRGFDMFWIIGGDQLIRHLTRISPWEWDQVLGEQMRHVAWAGFHFYDLIFPLFMFLAGVSIPYAILGKRDKGVSRKKLGVRILRRAISLVILGMIYNGLLNFDFASLRVASVLGQIGVAYGIAATIVLFSRNLKTPLYWCIGILLAYSVVQLFVPVPEHGTGVLTKEGCVNGCIDRMLLPGQLYGGVFDPEGLLCMLSASALVLFGVQAGHVLRNQRWSGYRKTAILAGAGTGLLLLGILIAPVYPSIKSLWTTTFNLISGGLSMLLLALFYLVIDVWKIRRWSFFFHVIGLNSITIYLAARMIHFGHTSSFLFSGTAKLFGAYEPVILTAGIIALEWGLLWVLYKKKIFLKV